MKPPSRRVGIGVAVLASLLALGTAEAVLRLVHLGSLAAPTPVGFDALRRPHPTRGWVLEPEATAWIRTRDYAVSVSTNSRGFRDVEHSLAPAGGTYRVVVLGDSFMEAYQVPLEHSFSRLLETRLRDCGVEVINLGVGGYGTAQELVTLREEGTLYGADLVLLAFHPGNDLRNNHRRLERVLWGGDEVKVFGRPYGRLGADGRLEIVPPEVDRVRRWIEERPRRREPPGPLRRTFLWDLGRRAGSGLLAGGEGTPSHDPGAWLGVYSPELSAPGGPAAGTADPGLRVAWQRSHAVTAALLEAVRRSSSQTGAGFLLVTVPARFEVEPEYREGLERRFPRLLLDPDLPYRWLQGVAGRRGWPLLDLLQAFRGAAHGEPLFHRLDDLHWNEEGHRLAAETTAAYLRRRVPGCSSVAEPGGAGIARAVRHHAEP